MLFPRWIEWLPSDTLLLGSSLLSVCWSLFLPNISFSSCKNDSKWPNQTGSVWLVLKKPLKTALTCYLSLPPSPGVAGGENCRVIPKPIFRRIPDSFFHARLEGPRGILGTHTSSTRKVDEHSLTENYMLDIVVQLPFHFEQKTFFKGK